MTTPLLALTLFLVFTTFAPLCVGAVASKSDSGSVVTYLNANGDGARVTLIGNPYDPIAKITASVAENCKAYPATVNTTFCRWINSGEKVCGKYYSAFWNVSAVSAVSAVSSVSTSTNNSQCGDNDQNVVQCIVNIVQDKACAYTFLNDPFMIGIVAFFSFVIVVSIITILIYKCCKRRRLQQQQYYPHPYQYHNIR